MPWNLVSISMFAIWDSLWYTQRKLFHKKHKFNNWTGTMTWWAKCLLCKHEDLSSDPWNPNTMLSIYYVPAIPVQRGWRWEIHEVDWLASLPESGSPRYSERLCPKKWKWREIKEDIQCLLLASTHMHTHLHMHPHTCDHMHMKIHTHAHACTFTCKKKRNMKFTF